MLHEFLSENRDDLIIRCRLKVSQRPSPPASESELLYGVPLILDQLYGALVQEQAMPTRLRDLIDRSLPEVRMASGMVTPPAGP